MATRTLPTGADGPGGTASNFYELPGNLREGGALFDPDLDGGESQAMMSLFDGAIGLFKNPPSHRTVTYADPTEASEVVLLADLLLRMLDRVEARLTA